MAKTISIIIPNYNGATILKKNLSHVLKQCPECETIVVDDASSDNSKELIKKYFPEVRLVENIKNLGFGESVNRGANLAKGELILLLNSDVAPRAKFLDFAVEHFEKKDSNLFAVGLADLSHEGTKIIVRGRGGAKFEKGLLRHFAIKQVFGETLWVSGGSSLIDRQRFLELGGFDSLFAPFYWEDVDLCYRAQKSGLICFFEPRAQVDHYHEEGAIKKKFSPNFIKIVSNKNQFLFVWKNINDYFLVLLHLLWLPYRFARALFALDHAFFIGFLWAVFTIPKLVLSSKFDPSTSSFDSESLRFEELRAKVPSSKLSDKEVLKKFENQ